MSAEPAPHRNLLLIGIGAFVAALLLAAVWRWTPLNAYADPKALAALLHQLRESPWALLVIIGIYIAANAMLFPNTVLNIATILGLGTTMGLPCALAGSLAAGLVAYAAGHYFGAERLQRLEAGKLERLSARLRRGGILGITMLRLLPIAPYTVVNLMAGAARVGVVPFSVGTLLGLLPGNLLVTAFGHQLRSMIREPSVSEVVAMVAIIFVAAAGLWWLRTRAAVVS